MISVYEIAETVGGKSNFSLRSMKQQVTDHAMSSKKKTTVTTTVFARALQY